MAKPVHKDSNDCSSSSLDLFLLPPTQSSFQKGKSIDYHPITSLSDGGPIEFKVSGSGKEFLDLARSYLYLKVKVSKADGSNLDGASKVGFANYPIASLLNQVDDAFLGEIPKRIAICMIDNGSSNGNYKKNPFNFQHYNLTQIGISVNGEEIPFKPLKLNFDDKLFVTGYNTLLSGTGKLHGNDGSIIKREDYSEGYTIIVADLTQFEIGDNFDLKAEGTLSIDVVFKTPLAATINVLVYAEYDSVIEIDSNCKVIKDWSN